MNQVCPVNKHEATSDILIKQPVAITRTSITYTGTRLKRPNQIRKFPLITLPNKYYVIKQSDHLH